MSDEQQKRLSAYERYGLPVDGGYKLRELIAIALRVGVDPAATKGELITALNDRLRGQSLPPQRLVEIGGERDGLPVVLILPSEMASLLSGRALRTGTVGGQEVVVRTPTPQELLALAEQAGDRLEALGVPRGPGMTLADAERLCRMPVIE